MLPGLLFYFSPVVVAAVALALVAVRLLFGAELETDFVIDYELILHFQYAHTATPTYCELTIEWRFKRGP